MSSRMHYGHATRAIGCENLWVKCHALEMTRTLCSSLRTGNVRRANFMWNFMAKCRTTRPGTPFRASLRSQTARGHFTRAILYGNLEACWTQRIPLNTEPEHLLWEPSVWPHCLVIFWKESCIISATNNQENIKHDLTLHNTAGHHASPMFERC